MHVIFCFFTVCVFAAMSTTSTVTYTVMYLGCGRNRNASMDGVAALAGKRGFRSSFIVFGRRISGVAASLLRRRVRKGCGNGIWEEVREGRSRVRLLRQVQIM
jgi:hypothetical protein